MSMEKLEALPTQRLLPRLRQLHQCEQSLAHSDRDCAEESGVIEFKESPGWILAFEELKKVLSRREHIPRRSAQK
jgi:hypothetical protein